MNQIQQNPRAAIETPDIENWAEYLVPENVAAVRAEKIAADNKKVEKMTASTAEQAAKVL